MIVGTMIGESSSPSTAFLPGNEPRTRATAAAVPITVPRTITMKPTSKPFCRYLLPNQSKVPWPDWISTSRPRSGSLFVQSAGWWAWGMTSTSLLLF